MSVGALVGLVFAWDAAHLAEVSAAAPTDPPATDEPATAPAPSETPAAPSAAPEPEAPPPSTASVGPISGRVFTYLRSPFRDGALHQASASIWLEVSPRLGPSYAHVVVSADALAASIATGPRLRPLLREGYGGIQTDHFDLRIGQQIIPWGNGDVFNPTDLLTARDFTFFSANPEANRLGVLSARATYTATHFSATAVFTPVAPVSTLLIPSWMVPPGLVLARARPPRPTLAHSEVAGKMGVNGDGWDVSVMGFRGYNHIPEYEFRGVDPVTGGVDIGPTQHSYNAVGGEASVGIKKYVLRIETAYVVTDNPDGRRPIIQPTHWDTTAGVETSFFEERLRVQVQGITRIHPNYYPTSSTKGTDDVTTAISAAVAQANSIFQNYTVRHRIMTSGRVAYATSDEKFSAEVLTVVSLEGSKDLFVRPLAAYRPTDALKFELGADLYAGPRTTPLGALRGFSGGFLEATYQF